MWKKIFGVTLLLGINITNLPIINAGFKNTIDGEKDEQEIREWGQMTAHDWIHNKLNSVEKEKLTAYTSKWGNEINRYLKLVHGQLNQNHDFFVDEWEKSAAQELDKDIKILDGALDKIKTRESITVYKRLQESHFNLQPTQLFRSKWDLRINIDLFNQINRNFSQKNFVFYNFVSTSLIKDVHGITAFHSPHRPILMHIQVPKGIHGGYIASLSKFPAEQEFLIKRGYTFRYEKFSIVNDINWQTLKVVVSLLKKIA